MKIKLVAVLSNKPIGIATRTQGVFSSASWQYNKAGQQYNQVGVEYGGSDRRQDIGPRLLKVTDI